MAEEKKVIFIHRCPVCKYQTKESYLMDITHLEIKNTDIVSFKFLKEKNDKKEFDRFECCGRVLLCCPKCGSVLSGEICESVE